MVMDDPAAFASAFGGAALFIRQGVQPENVWADVADAEPWRGIDPNLARAWEEGFCRLAQARLLASQVQLAPSWGDELLQDGQTWRVENIIREGGMWVLGLIASAMEVEVVIEARVPSKDADGFDAAAWQAAGSVRGEVWAMSGSEREAQGSSLGSTVWRVRIPAWPGLTPAHRLTIGERTLDVRSVDDLGMRGRTMIVEAVETLAREAT